MKGPFLEYLEQKEKAEKSPAAQGLLGAAKGALVGAPVGAAIGLLSGRGPFLTGFIGAALLGGALGTVEAVSQDIANKEREAEMKVYLENLKNREPFFFEPPSVAKPVRKVKPIPRMPQYVY